MNPTNPAISKKTSSISLGIQPSKRQQSGSAHLPQAATTSPKLQQVASHKLFRQFTEAIESCSTIDGFLQVASTIVSEHAENLALWISKRDDQGEFDQIHAISDNNASSVWQLVETTCRQITPFVVKSRQTCSSPLQKYEHHQVIAAPVISTNEIEYILYGCFSTQKQTVYDNSG